MHDDNEEALQCRVNSKEGKRPDTKYIFCHKRQTFENGKKIQGKHWRTRSPRSGALEADGAMLRGVATESRKKSHRHFGMAAVAK